MKTTIKVRNNDWQTKRVKINRGRFIKRYTHKFIPTFKSMISDLNK